MGLVTDFHYLHRTQTSMHVERLTTPDQVLRLWDVFREGLQTIMRITDERTTEDEYCKMLVNLAARTDDAWVGVAFSGGPMSYGVVVDSTPPHSSRKTFTVVSFYAMPGQPDATQALMHAFEAWARERGVKSYVVTTRRDSGAIRCFRSSRYGFRKAYIAFEKHL